MRNSTSASSAARVTSFTSPKIKSSVRRWGDGGGAGLGGKSVGGSLEKELECEQRRESVCVYVCVRVCVCAFAFVYTGIESERVWMG